MESREDGYTIGQLINDLSSYETLISRSEGYIRKQADRPALKGSPAAHYAIQAAVTRSDASKVWDRIPADAFDFIRPLCEAQGKFDIHTLKILRANLCIWLGEKESLINAMSLHDFAEITSFRNQQRPKLSEELKNAIIGSQTVFERIAKNLQATVTLPDHLVPTDTDNWDSPKVEQAPKESVMYENRGYTAAEARKQLGLGDSQFSNYRGKAGIAAVKKGETYSTESVMVIARYIYFESGAIKDTKKFSRQFLKAHGGNIPE